jgi:hypothetical protein
LNLSEKLKVRERVKEYHYAHESKSDCTSLHTGESDIPQKYQISYVYVFETVTEFKYRNIIKQNKSLSKSVVLQHAIIGFSDSFLTEIS